MNIILPMEIVNKILIMRPTHPVAVIMKEKIENYIEYINGDYDIAFNEYFNRLKDLLISYNIRKIKNTNDNLVCGGCYRTMTSNTYYYRNSHTINCEICF